MIDNVYTISPQQINYILELHATRNFQKASAKCFVTQPTLSMQIKKAEDTLGFLIFDRSRNPLELTESGKQLIPLLQDVQTEYARIWNLKQKLEGNYIQHLRIGVIPTISNYLLVDIFEEVKREMSNVQVEIIEMKSEQLIEAISEKKVDIAIMAGPYNEPRLRTVPLYHEEILIYAPQISKKKISPVDIENMQPWLLSKGNCLRTQMVHFCDLNSLEQEQRNWNYEGGSIDLLMKMVDLNGGYTLVPKFFKKELQLKRLMDVNNNEYPARQVIALIPQRSIKGEICTQLIRIIQLKYGKNETSSKMRILSWR